MHRFTRVFSGKTRQHGFASLFMVLIVALVLGGVALQTGQTGFSTQRLANNEYHAAQSMAAAQAGIDYMVAVLRKDPTPYIDSAGKIVTRTSNGVVGPIELNRAIDVTNGTVVTSNPSSGIGFSVALDSSTATGTSGTYEIVIKSTGCATGLCSASNPESKTIRQTVKLAIPPPPGKIDPPGLLIRGNGQSAKNRTSFGGQLVVSNNRGSGVDVMTDDHLMGSLPVAVNKTAPLAKEDNNTLLARYFTRILLPGVTLMDTLKNESTKGNTMYSGNTGLDKMAADWQKSKWSDTNPSPVYWVQGNLTITASTTIGNEDTDPVAIIVTGDCLTAGDGNGAMITGLLVCLGDYKSLPGSYNSIAIRVYGHLAVGGVMQINWATMQIDNTPGAARDKRFYAKLTAPPGGNITTPQVTRLPGQWKDYP